MAFTFGENRDQHVGAGHFRPARALHMDRRALDHPLEAGGRRGLRAVDIRNQAVQFLVQETDQRAPKKLKIDTAGPHDAGGVGFVHQGQQQMLQRRQLVAPLVRIGQRLMDRGFQRVRE